MGQEPGNGRHHIRLSTAPVYWPEDKRSLTVHGQQYVPGDRTRILLPLVFCRECGQEYYCVRYHHDDESGARMFTPRELSDHLEDEESKAGFLYFSSSDPWPEDIEELIASGLKTRAGASAKAG